MKALVQAAEKRSSLPAKIYKNPCARAISVFQKLWPFLSAQAYIELATYPSMQILLQLRLACPETQVDFQLQLFYFPSLHIVEFNNSSSK